MKPCFMLKDKKKAKEVLCEKREELLQEWYNVDRGVLLILP